MPDYSKWDRIEVSDDEDEAEAARPPPAPPKAAAATPQTAEELMTSLAKAEQLGEEVLLERQQMVELGRRQNANREALAALRRTVREHGEAAASTHKPWMCMGDVFMRQPHATAKQMLEKDQSHIEREIERLRSSVKQKSSKLCELDPSIAGGSNIHRSFVDLHGMSANELSNVFVGQ